MIAHSLFSTGEAYMAKTAKEVGGILEFPIGAVNTKEYASGHVNVQLGCEKREYAMKMVTEQLMRSGARVRGRGGETLMVNTTGRAMLWLLDRIVDNAEENGITLTK